jgi:hypothetical protein
MTPLRVSIIASIAALLLILGIFELIRRSRLRERYAILWLVTAVVVLVFSVWRTGLEDLAGVFGVSYAPALLFAIGAFFVLLVLLHYSTVISKLADQNTILAQKVALLELRLRGDGGAAAGETDPGLEPRA